jgi:hypothetical protein
VSQAALDLEAGIDRLYRLPPTEFVRARDALVGELRKAGDREGAVRVKALVRPSSTAWAVNQLYWSARVDLQRFLSAAGGLLQAQEAAFGGADRTAVRTAMRRKTEALQLALRRAERFLADAGLPTGPAVSHRIGATLEALAAASLEGGVRAGRLATDLAAPGFDAAAGLADALPVRAPRVDEKADAPVAPSAQDGTRADVMRMEAEVGRLRREAASATQALAEAGKRAAGAEGERAEAERRLGQARERALRAQEALAKARSEAADAEVKLRGAEASLEAARKKTPS